MSLEEAAAVWFGGFTALHFLKRANLQPGQKILIYGASGSVGVFPVQLAKYFGAHVTAVCSTSNLALAASLGADEVLDYTRQDFSKAGRVYDVVFDAVGKSGFSRSLNALRKGGCYVRVGASGGTLSILGSMLRELWTSRLAAVNMISGVAVGTPTNQLLLKSKHRPRRRATKRKRNFGGRGSSAQPVSGVVRDFTRGRVRCAREFLRRTDRGRKTQNCHRLSLLDE